MDAQGNNSGTRTEYPCNGKYRGRALIIANDTFKMFPERKGARHDVKNMKRLFSRLDFKVTLYKNLKTLEMKKKIEQAALDEKNRESDCFVLVISSHGSEYKFEEFRDGCLKEATVWITGVCGSDDGTLGIDDILSNFEDNKSVGLAGKPKLFFIQACRSREDGNQIRVDPGLQVNIRKTKSSHEKDDRNKSGNDGIDCMLKVDSTRINLETQQTATCKDLNKPDDTDQSQPNDKDEYQLDEKYQNQLHDKDQQQLIVKDQYHPDNKDQHQPNDQNQQKPNDKDQGDKLSESSSQPRPQAEDPFEFCKDYEDIYKEWTDSGDESDVSKSEETSSNTEVHTKPGPDNPDALPPAFQLVSAIGTKVDAKSGPGKTDVPPVPFELAPAICPKDCLVMYPVMPGRFAFHNDDIGSHLFYYMYENRNILVNGKGLLKYLTHVTSDMAKDEIDCDKKYLTEEEINNLPFKHCACITHRLTSDVLFKPKTSKTLMAIVKQFLRH